MSSISEGQVNLITTGTRLEGRVEFDQTSRVQGIIIGEVHAKVGSTLILAETSVVEGKISADTLFIEGLVKADIEARTRVIISRTGRVIGKIRSPSLKVEFGAFFEGQCDMNSESKPSEQRNPL